MTPRPLTYAEWQVLVDDAEGDLKDIWTALQARGLTTTADEAAKATTRREDGQ